MGSVLGIAHFTFHDGRADDFCRLSQKCLEIVAERDTGTLRYDVFVNADRTGAVVIEEYVDEAALVEHADHLGPELSEEIIATANVHGEILGELSAEFLAGLEGGPVRPFAPLLSLGPRRT